MSGDSADRIVQDLLDDCARAAGFDGGFAEAERIGFLASMSFFRIDKDAYVRRIRDLKEETK